MCFFELLFWGSIGHFSRILLKLFFTKTTCKVETPLLSSQFYLEANRFPPEASEIIQIFYKKQKEPNNQNPINKKAFKLAVILIQYKPFSWSFSNHPRIVYEVSSKEWESNPLPPLHSSVLSSVHHLLFIVVHY